MKSDEIPLEIFFQKLPMSTALFDHELVLQRYNPTWLHYIEGISQILVEPGTQFYDLLPGTESTIQPLIKRTLTGVMTAADGLRLNCNDNVFYWDAAFVPWVEEEKITGFLLVVADVTERVLSRQILERKVVDRTQKLSALYDVMTVAAEPLDLRKKLDDSLARVLDAVHAQAGSIQLLDNEGEALLLAAHQGFDTELTGKLRVLPADSGLNGWAVKHQQPLILADIVTDQRTPDFFRHSGFRAYVGVPMTSRGKTLGILSVFRNLRRPYSEEDISLLDSVADQIGTAIENARLRLENEQLLIVEERNRLARELHDAVTQSLYSLTLYAETSLRFSRAGQFDMANNYMEQVAETAQQALREMRLLLHNLRPAVLEQLGLVKAIGQRFDAVEKRVGVAVDYQIDGEIDLPSRVEEALFHIVQEALNNALKHAAATEICLILSQQENRVTLTVADNGKGFRLADMNDSGGLGLLSMRERVDSLGGEFYITSEEGGGSKINVALDLAHLDEQPDALDILNSL
ncbi:MAG: GAF domain-containing protein [Candidatus Promineifilaceae bacterium]|jgi:signal transduction histidine kinase